MPRKPELHLSKKSKQSAPGAKSRAQKATPTRWRDVTMYFNTLDAETRGLKMLANAVRDHLKPKNVFERMWCDDIIALSWQAHQLRKIKEYIIFEGAREVVSERLKIANRKDPRKELDNDGTYDAAASGYVLAHPLAKALEEKLTNAGMLLDHRFHMGYLARSNDLEHIDRLIFAHEKRRDDLIDRLEARRA